MSVKTILCVDDSPTQLRVITEALSGRGYRIVTACDGEEALQKIAETSPDLVAQSEAASMATICYVERQRWEDLFAFLPRVYATPARFDIRRGPTVRQVSRYN